MNKDSLKTKIYSVINNNYIYSATYAITLIVSILPLMFKHRVPILHFFETIAVIFFICDYILRYYCADIVLKKGKKSYLIYPFTLYALVDLVAIIPFFLETLGFLVPIRVLRLLKLLRVFKILRYNKQIEILKKAIKRERHILEAILGFVSVYIFVIALVAFQIEPETFNNFFDAVYWSTISLTTVGYGDIYTVTTLGKIVSIISSIIGVGIICLPSGIIAASFVEVYREDRQDIQL
ncbi:MAG: ion transporter [Clostridium sp.]